MTFEAVKAEAAAVGQLASAITCYAEHLRTAAGQARAEARHRHQLAEQEAERRRCAMEQARQALTQARAALARCHRENCAALQQVVEQAQQRFDRAEQEYRAARRAVSMIAGAEAELLRSVHTTESVVTTHASASVKALAKLGDRLRDYDIRRHQSQAPGPGHASALQNVAITLEVLRGLTGLGHSLATANFIPSTPAPVAVSARADDQDRDGQLAEQEATRKLDQLKEENEKLGRKPDGT